MRQIRQAHPFDLPGMYRVCLLTGDAGADATARFRNPDLLGHVYVGPYVAGQPAFAQVVADEDGVAGYCLGALDTRAFAAWAERAWWPVLREQYPAPAPEELSPDAELIRQIHEPGMAGGDLLAAYPSHLHIDLLERCRGTGLGRRLMERLLADLGAHGSPGVHLGVAATNANAIAFYRHLGFEELRAHPDALVMGLRLQA
jgi:ribosomal protein S18 acetylase RimI-like enzyme